MSFRRHDGDGREKNIGVEKCARGRKRSSYCIDRLDL
jgi:hypothetical protein